MIELLFFLELLVTPFQETMNLAFWKGVRNFLGFRSEIFNFLDSCEPFLNWLGASPLRRGEKFTSLFVFFAKPFLI